MQMVNASKRPRAGDRCLGLQVSQSHALCSGRLAWGRVQPSAVPVSACGWSAACRSSRKHRAWRDAAQEAGLPGPHGGAGHAQPL